ncbi:UBX domain-containing protein 7 isoform X2 [Nematostella vectensis]|uniref:UBX domain-containing protein 7 isoform X2 n=1 Tax=Nematostella vectensis TaxID=45351 RepID=UPI00138FDD37|nr:UBX domain-containing protein 7 isoform X2 [Nematostella vectensis]
MAEKWSHLIDEFTNVTGATRQIATSLLEASNGNLEMAIEMHFDSCGDQDAVSSAGVAGSSHTNEALTSSDNDEVRAPIPQTRGILVDQPYHSFGTRKKTSKSVFDAFRDFQAEAKQQEQQATGSATSKKQKTLQDLFRPPIDLLHKGTFETGKAAGQQQKKWILVNVQDVQEFKCQQLNRDVWSNEQVRNIIKAHFILWQVYRDTDEGERFIQFYHVTRYPYIGIVDPRTGEKLDDWSFVDAQAFCEHVTEFLLNHSTLDGESPPKKKVKRESIVDASEDSQLEAAIAASLRYSTSTKDDNTSDNDGDDDDDYEDLEFTDSEAEESEWKPQKVSKQKQTTNNKQFSKESSSSSKDNCSADISSSTESSYKNEAETIKNGASFKESVKTVSPTVTSSVAESSPVSSTQNNESSSSKAGSSVENTETFKRWEVQAGPMCKIMVRFPNGSRKQVSLQAEAPLMALVQFAHCEGFPNERYELLTNFPRRKLSFLDFNTTLKTAGLYPQETVFVQERLM